MAAKPVHAQLGSMWIRCHVCGGDRFREREVLLNSSGMELFNLAWANEAATGLICWTCGYVHMFVNPNLQTTRAQA
ncbi:hypothetical protein [Streptomyces sp. KLOTTS4A1]|uniref:hypothetical protein n=1 Tax=Streptomyces sp. KLOTTS4A1 TaxID=3390996 RepID=UPI0039F578D4